MPVSVADATLLAVRLSAIVVVLREMLYVTKLLVSIDAAVRCRGCPDRRDWVILLKVG